MHSKFVGHSTEIVWQSKIKGPLKQKSIWEISLDFPFEVKKNLFLIWYSILKFGYAGSSSETFGNFGDSVIQFS